MLGSAENFNTQDTLIDISFTGTGINDLEIAVEGEVEGDFEVEIVEGDAASLKKYLVPDWVDKDAEEPWSS